MIRSKLDYGCIVYGSACPTYLKQLNSIQNQALRLCLGAFRSSPVHSLHVEADELPLKFRRQKLSLQYGLKLKSHPVNPAYEFVYPTDYEYKICLERRAIPAFRVRFKQLLNNCDIDADNIAIHEELHDYPLWDNPPIHCLTHIASFEKENTLPDFYRNEFYIIKNNFPEHECIYTDGSKQDNKVGYAYVTSLFTIATRISDGSSIFTAEALAVLKSLEYIQLSTFQKFIIFSDSLSLIQSIESENIKNSIVVSIFKLIGSICELGKEVLFCWIPSHCGINGNEKADRAAKQALSQEITPMKIPYNDKIPSVKKSICIIRGRKNGIKWLTTNYSKLNLYLDHLS